MLSDEVCEVSVRDTHTDVLSSTEGDSCVFEENVIKSSATGRNDY